MFFLPWSNLEWRETVNWEVLGGGDNGGAPDPGAPPDLPLASLPRPLSSYFTSTACDRTVAACARTVAACARVRVPAGLKTLPGSPAMRPCCTASGARRFGRGFSGQGQEKAGCPAQQLRDLGGGRFGGGVAFRIGKTGLEQGRRLGNQFRGRRPGEREHSHGRAASNSSRVIPRLTMSQ